MRIFSRTTKKYWLATVLLSLALLLGGCTEDDINALAANHEITNTSPIPSSSAASLSGTAATGAAIVGHIVITDVNGYTNSNVIINPDGTFNADVTNMVPPFILSAIPDDSSQATQYSYAGKANKTVNLTPLTSLALFMAYNKEDIRAIANHWVAYSNKITETVLATAQTQINSNFDAQLQAHGLNPGSYDFFTTPFTTDNTGIDAVLDSLSINIDMEAGAFSVKINNIPFDFNTGADSDNHRAAPPLEQSDTDISATDGFDQASTNEPDDVISIPATWQQTITGTVLTAGFQRKVAEMTTTNLSAAATAEEIETTIISEFLYGVVAGEVTTNKITAEADLVVYEVSFETTGMSYSLVYEYIKEAG